MKTPTPVQRLWAAVFGRPEKETPALDTDKVQAIVDSLSGAERTVLRLYYGFDGSLTLKEIGRRLRRADGGQGVTRQRVQAIRSQALRRLRHRTWRRAWQEAIEKHALS